MPCKRTDCYYLAYGHSPALRNGNTTGHSPTGVQTVTLGKALSCKSWRVLLVIDTFESSNNPKITLPCPCRTGLGQPALRTPGKAQPTPDPTLSPLNSTDPSANLAFCSREAPLS